MVVLAHSCIPLTSNLKRLREAQYKSDVAPTDDLSFKKVCEVLTEAVRYGTPSQEDLSWTYEYDSLWSPLTRDIRGRRINIWRCGPERLIEFLRTRTYWYKRLGRVARSKLKHLIKRSQSGLSKLKDILDTTDGVQVSLLLSFPEMYLKSGYELSDRITCSIISNCLHNYDKFNKDLKFVRKTVKHCMLNKIRIDLDPNQFRHMSFMRVPIQVFNEYKDRNSKEKMFRTATFSQTRATGLAGTRTVNESIRDFVNTVTQERTFEPNAQLERAIEVVAQGLSRELNLGRNPEFKISMSTSACRESSQRKEGKFGYLKQLVRKTGLVIPPLEEGIPGAVGDFCFDYAMRKIDKQKTKDKVLEVNVAAVRENGKARVITSGSFWKDVALQPFSHITIHLIKKFANLRSGLQAGRLGWRFIDKIEKTPGDSAGFNWIFDQKQVYVYSTDWEKATDKPTPKMAWSVTGRVLEYTGLQKDILRKVKEYWLGPKSLYYKGRKVGTAVNGVLMGDPLTKTNLSLAHPICDVYARLKTGELAYEEGNGDDTIAMCSGPAYAEAHAEAASMLGYEQSTLDTAVTQDWGTYCEEWFHRPISGVNTCRWATRLKNSKLLPYLDVPKIRILIATEKDRADFSSDPKGKTTLMGHDQEYFNRFDPGPGRTIFNICSAIQDISLATVDQNTPLFMPRQVHGVGKPPPEWNTQSWLNIIRNSRPWVAKYYVTMMNDINEGHLKISGFKGALKPSNHFQKEMMVERFEIPSSSNLRKYIVVEADCWSDYPEGVLLKLVTMGYLIPESKIAKYFLFQQRLESLEQDLPDADLFECVKSKLVSYPDYDLTSPEVEEIVARFSNDYRDQPYKLNIGKEENLYISNVLDKIAEGNPLTVTYPYPLVKKFCKLRKPDTPYETRGMELYQWFMKAYQSLKKGEDYDLPPTDIIEDDPIIIQTIADGGADIFIIATDDKKLHRLAVNKFPDTFVFRISAVHYLQTNTWCSENDLDYDEQIQSAFHTQYGTTKFSVQTLVDKGSVDTWLNQHTNVGNNNYTRVVGIPWRKNIHVRNVERDSNSNFFHTPKIQSFRDLRIPLSLYDWETHRTLRRSLIEAVKENLL